MKKVILFVFSLLVAGILSGCGNGENDNSSASRLTTLFLVDQEGFSYGYIPYKCDSMREWSRTAPNGEFTFLPPDNCEFDFIGYNGDNGYGFINDDFVRIVDIGNNGKGGIPYTCESFGASSTFNDGSFYYDEDDRCVFFL